MIVGLCGLKNSGKDTVGAYLIKEYSYQRKSFAEPLKRSVAALFDIPYEEIEMHKNVDNVFASLGYKNHPIELEDSSLSGMWSPIKEFSFREFLQRYGTEAHRNVFGENFWVDQCLPLDGFYGSNIVVTDCRFKNEALRIIDLGGCLVYVSRAGLVNEDPHSSERPETLPFNYQLNNNGTIEELYDEIEHVLKAIKADYVQTR